MLYTCFMYFQNISIRVVSKGMNCTIYDARYRIVFNLFRGIRRYHPLDAYRFRLAIRDRFEKKTEQNHHCVVYSLFEKVNMKKISVRSVGL